MRLKVGELARHSGLTVRTLHHYDEIGLVRPSARSGAGYRLYDEHDVARLHAVQALRQLGFGLARIGELLQGDAAVSQRLVTERIRAVDEELARARELRAQLVLLQDTLAAGGGPQSGPWPSTLSLMATYRRHFSPRELRSLLRRWRRLKAGWRPLREEAAVALELGLAPDAPQVQALAQRWMERSMEFTAGDLPLALRWVRMNEQSPETARHQGSDPDVLAFVGRAIELRLQALRRHLGDDGLQRLDTGLSLRWRWLVERAQALMVGPQPTPDPAARELIADWDRLLGEMTRRDPELQARLVQAYRSEPLLQHGHVVTPQVRGFVEELRRRLGAPAPGA